MREHLFAIMIVAWIAAAVGMSRVMGRMKQDPWMGWADAVAQTPEEKSERRRDFWRAMFDPLERFDLLLVACGGVTFIACVTLMRA